MISLILTNISDTKTVVAKAKKHTQPGAFLKDSEIMLLTIMKSISASKLLKDKNYTITHIKTQLSFHAIIKMMLTDKMRI